MSLDSELLALAGDDFEEDGEEEEELQEEELHDLSVKESSPEADPSPPAPSSPKKRSRTATSSKRSRKRVRRSNDSDDDEESESLSEPGSEFEVASQSEADEPTELNSSLSDDEDDLGNLYPLEGKYKDHADKEKLMAMTEIDREAVLADRAAALERAHQDRQLRNLLKSRNESAASASAGVRKSARTKSAPKKSEEATKRGKLDELKRTREERKAGGGKSAYAEEDASRRLLDDEDDKFDDYGFRPDEREVELKDANRCRIGRSGFGKLCDYPEFEATVIDCFVRLSLFDKENQRTVYRVAQIKGFQAGKPYSMLEGARRTERHVILCQGKAERSFPMDMMSDGSITEQEFNRFKKQCEVDGVSMPSLTTVASKSRALRELDAKVLTPAEVDAIIRKRNAGKVDAVSLVLKRSDLRERRERAMADGDDEEVARIDREIQELEDQSRARPRARQETQMERMSRINAENRRKNLEEIRRAELEEKRQARLAAQGKAEFQNPFMRVKTVVKFRHDMTKKPEPVKKVEKPEIKEEDPTDKPSNGVGLMNGAAPAAGGKKKGGIDDVIASMDIEIDL